MLKWNYDSERQMENERWLWTSNWEEIVAMNAKLRRDSGSQSQSWEEIVALNVKAEKR